MFQELEHLKKIMDKNILNFFVSIKQLLQILKKCLLIKIYNLVT